MFFGSSFLGGEDPQILDLVFKIAPISDHVAKFRYDRPRDRGDPALNEEKKEKKETAAKHKGRVALSQRAALIMCHRREEHNVDRQRQLLTRIGLRVEVGLNTLFHDILCDSFTIDGYSSLIPRITMA